jgi:hypothetical protein
VSRPPHALTTLGAPPARIHKRTQIIEPVGRNQSGRHQFPQSLLDLCGQMTRHRRNIRKETCTSLLQRPANVLSYRAQGNKWIRAGHAFVFQGIQQPSTILS